MSDSMKDDYVQLSDVRLHIVSEGDGPLVVLLHGFPDFWYSWRHQLPALAEAGYRAVAPDMRGYNLSDKPRRISEYSLDRLATDVVELVERLGEGNPAAVVGHDWGGVIAWAVAAWHPDIVDRVAICNAPHPDEYRRGLTQPKQLAKSWYTGFFQIPGAPVLLRARNFAPLRTALRSSSNDGTFTDEDLERYVEAWSQPRALESQVAYYRAGSRRTLGRSERLPPVERPLMVIWGERDRSLEPFFADVTPELAVNATVERLSDATHWVHMDAPDEVSALLLDFLGEPE